MVAYICIYIFHTVHKLKKYMYFYLKVRVWIKKNQQLPVCEILNNTQLLPHRLYTSPGTAVVETPGSGYSSEESRGAGLSAKITQLSTQLWLNVWSRRHKRATEADPNFRKTKRVGRNAFSSLEFRTKGQALIFWGMNF